jgi:hypothetical protein
MHYKYMLLDMKEEQVKIQGQLGEGENPFLTIINHWGTEGWKFLKMDRGFGLFQRTSIDEEEKVVVQAVPEPEDYSSGMPFEIM